MDNLALAKTFLIFSLILIHLLTDPILVIVAAIVIVYGDHDGHHGGRLRRGASSRLSRRIIGRKIAPFYHRTSYTKVSSPVSTEAIVG